MLRIVRLPEAVVEPAPVSLDTEYALDNCIRREGWLVFMPDVNVWGIPLPLGDLPFRVATESRVDAAGADPRTIWLRHRNSRTLTEYDGLAREVRREVELPGPEFSLATVTASGFLLNSESGLHAWEPPRKPRLLLADAGAQDVTDNGRARVLGWRLSTGVLLIIDPTDGSHVTVPGSGGGRWRDGVFSPDGNWLALDLDCSPVTTLEEARVQFRDVVQGGATYEPKPHRLGLVRCADGALMIADGVYDNFANLVWSLDSKWIAFNTPFAPRGLWLTRPETAKLEWISFGRRHAPSLLCDASDLVI